MINIRQVSAVAIFTLLMTLNAQADTTIQLPAPVTGQNLGGIMLNISIIDDGNLKKPDVVHVKKRGKFRKRTLKGSKRRSERKIRKRVNRRKK